ncbi:N-acetylmuramoyl-L-alanine amidase [Caproiciproducens sp.]
MNIIQKPSKNFNSRGPWAPNVIVNHITGGNKVSSAINEFTVNDRASAHFVVDLDGTVYQCVDIRQAAWGNGTSQTQYYSAVQDGKTVSLASKVWSQYSKLDIVRNRKVNANLYTISIEHVNAGGGVLTAPQLAATIELHKYIIAEVKRIYGITIPIDREHITGHCFIAPKTKPSCPGAYFPYDSILAGILGKIEVKSDTTCDMVMKQGATYQLKLTSIIQPAVTIGTAGVLTQELVRQTGNDYFVKIKAVGKPGTGAGVFANGKKLFAVNIE